MFKQLVSATTLLQLQDVISEKPKKECSSFDIVRLLLNIVLKNIDVFAYMRELRESARLLWMECRSHGRSAPSNWQAPAYRRARTFSVSCTEITSCTDIQYYV